MDIDVITQLSNAGPSVPGAASKAGHIAIVGLGNIGSVLAGLLARSAEVNGLTLIDPGSFEASNLKSQNISCDDVGKGKALVMASRLRKIRPDLELNVLPMAVENVPLGALQVDLICACLDSRISRCFVNEAARALSVPWIDAGVEPSNMLARVNVYRPESNCPCYECSFSEQDYQQLEVVYPCQGRSAAPPTNGPASLGTLAASLQAIEAIKVLRQQWPQAAVGRQITISAGFHKHFVTSFQVNSKCRCPHEPWTLHALETPSDRLTLGAVAELVSERNPALGAFGHTFVRQLACGACGYRTRQKILPLLARRLSSRHKTCPNCRHAMTPVGFTQTDALELHDLLPHFAERTLSQLGFMAGDIFTLRWAGGESHYQLACAPATSQRIGTRSLP